MNMAIHGHGDMRAIDSDASRAVTPLYSHQLLIATRELAEKGMLGKCFNSTWTVLKSAVVAFTLVVGECAIWASEGGGGTRTVSYRAR